MGHDQHSSNHKVEGDKSAIVVFTEYFSFLALINLLWLLASILIVPVFAATEAVFHCISRKISGSSFKLKAEFVSYLETNIWSSYKRGAPFALLLIILIIDAIIVFQMPQELALRSILLGAIIVLSILFLFLFFYSYARLVIREESLKERLVLSLRNTIKYPHYSLGLLLMMGVQVGLSLYFVPLFFFFTLSFPAFLFIFTNKKIEEKNQRKKDSHVL
ncbi:DUF624 domain-containing protein [Alkalibacterium pelagium]|uniref:Uncharacterized membrane protein YesL n=1 Tax=Alkalibacterium pelagium TaxID=426702 RepID=A0A1H7HGD4_9LACT|nr:DUF624 domain-containing protein [Alkalibacterium pelagium]GEN50446.1 hypothetical protein APE02nite_11110 [Alkalibacterium pelagium]SEK49436.1 Uncharacterized membrane protein YesL [Alkalibacterium pelagium]